MGTTRDDGSQQAMWVAMADLPQGGGHPFYERLNEILNAAGFDAFVEKLCAPFYARMGRPSLAPGRYFRLLLVGYFEGLDSERAIAWRAADSLSLRSFLRLAAPASPPDHSTISRTRRLLSVEAHQSVFTWVLQQLADAGAPARRRPRRAPDTSCAGSRGRSAPQATSHRLRQAIDRQTALCATCRGRRAVRQGPARAATARGAAGASPAAWAGAADRATRGTRRCSDTTPTSRPSP